MQKTVACREEESRRSQRSNSLKGSEATSKLAAIRRNSSYSHHSSQAVSDTWLDLREKKESPSCGIEGDFPWRSRGSSLAPQSSATALLPGCVATAFSTQGAPPPAALVTLLITRGQKVSSTKPALPVGRRLPRDTCRGRKHGIWSLFKQQNSLFTSKAISVPSVCLLLSTCNHGTCTRDHDEAR